MHKVFCGFLLGLSLILFSTITARSEIVRSSSLYSAYLMARQAELDYTPSKAARYYRDAYNYDPDNRVFLNYTILFDVMNGKIDSAAQLSRSMIRIERSHYLSRLVLAVEAVGFRQYNVALRHLSYASTANDKGAIVVSSIGLLSAWLYEALGDTDRAISFVEEIDVEKWFDLYRFYHAALINDFSGKKEEAAVWFEKVNPLGSGVLRILDSYTSFLLRNGEHEQVKEIAQSFQKEAQSSLLITKWQENILQLQVMESVVKSTQMGFAEVLYNFGTMLGTKSGEELSAVYLQLSLYLFPGSAFTLVRLADIYGDWKRHDLAVGLYARVPDFSLFKSYAEIRRASSYKVLNQTGKMIYILQKMVKKDPDDIELIAKLGNVYLGRKQFAKAIEVYSSGIDQVSVPQKKHWRLFYLRGIALDRSNEWAKAEKDLLESLKLYSNHPLVLNYLGYSWIEKGIYLGEAMKMITRSAEIRPNNGNIIDSLGWSYYKLGDYESAVSVLERALDLKPSDPVINDHLGDCYWKVGRKTEALYKWTHSLNLDPSLENLVRIKDKIEKGLPQIKDQRLEKAMQEGTVPCGISCPEE
ncbi:MAG: tetratricopeptide repeat protein [Alphaproteobacteria bacterium]|nr:tetratricopeptide repeat protein [Alphaproteobacteria bacterium]